MSAPEQGGLSSDELADWLGEMAESDNVGAEHPSMERRDQ